MIAIPVWYATASRMKDRKKMWAVDDQGMLRYGPGELEFIGRSQALRSSRLRDVRVVRPAFAYVSWVAVFALPLLLAAVMMFTTDDPMFTTLLGLSVGLTLAVGVTINRLQVWVRVEGEDEDGESFVAHFYDASAFGWGGIFGGTRRLASELDE